MCENGLTRCLIVSNRLRNTELIRLQALHSALITHITPLPQIYDLKFIN